MTPEKAFRQAFKGQPNIMTPDFLSYGTIGDNLFYEISRGRNLSDTGYIYGLTVLQEKDGEVIRRQDLSHCYHSKLALEDAIEDITNETII